MKSQIYQWEWVDSYLMQYNQILQDLKGRASTISPSQKLDYLKQVQWLEMEQNRFKAAYRKVQESSECEQEEMKDVLGDVLQNLKKSFALVIKKYK